MPVLATAQNYPALNVFWTMLELFLFIIWFFILIRVFSDIFRSHDMGGGAKAAWVIFVIIVPFLGVLIYLIARGGKMQERDIKQAQAQDAAMRSYVQDAAGTPSTAAELEKLSALHTQGVLTDAEFASQKAKLLA